MMGMDNKDAIRIIPNIGEIPTVRLKRETFEEWYDNIISKIDGAAMTMSNLDIFEKICLSKKTQLLYEYHGDFKTQLRCLVDFNYVPDKDFVEMMNKFTKLNVILKQLGEYANELNGKTTN
jgi:hypothetical protein